MLVLKVFEILNEFKEGNKNERDGERKREGKHVDLSPF